jgi:sugar phosphate isomerase/epimerase
MTLIGTDIKFMNGLSLWGGPPDALRAAASAGLQGVNIRTIDELSPTLDAGYLAEFAALATELDLYVEMGIGKVNPYMTSELPRVRDLGNGSYLDGMIRMIEACAEHGWTETWSAIGGFKPYPGIFFTDRFRTDTDWDDQLRATEKFLKLLAPALRANGVHLNLETHEEVTSFELLRLIEAVGDDVIGICLDPANMPVRAEVPLEAIGRLAPYIRTTQLRDAALWRTETGLARLLAPCGQGVIDWARVIAILLDHRPDIHLTIEGIGSVRAEMPLHLHDPRWRAGHPDLTDAALAELQGLAAAYEARSASGEVETLEQLRQSRADGRQAHEQFVAASAAHLRAAIAAHSEARN